MRTMTLAALIGLVFTAPVLAQTCPPVRDQSARFDALVAQIQSAPDERAARVLSIQLWEIWMFAPDDKAQGLLDHGMERFRVHDFDPAIAAFDELIEYCPHYAEGYNQRAFANFLQQDYALALEDLDLALERNPNHIAAMSGKALTLMELGRHEAGQAVLREALKLNPWLVERHRLTEVPGEDI
ncbi:MAG: tetratricopeptide repeat protein [Paracoccaceae bacterium]